MDLRDVASERDPRGIAIQRVGIRGIALPMLVSVKDGYHCGSPTMTGFVTLTGAHGNLRPASSTAFVMTTTGRVPDGLRMQNLIAALRALGVPLRSSPAPGQQEHLPQ